jgi:hypothetical protein
LLDAYAYITSIPHLWPIVVIFGFLGAGLTAYFMWYLIKVLTAVNSIVTSAHGDPETHHVLLQNIKEQNQETHQRVEKVEDLLEGHIPLCDQHFKDIDKIVDLEPFQNCPVENCPAWLKISNGYKDLQARLELFEVEAVNARTRTVENLREMSAGITKTSNELSALATEIIGIIRDGRFAR